MTPNISNVEDLPVGHLTPEQADVITRALLAVRDLKGVAVEIGSYLGRSSVLIARQIKPLYCIDVWHFIDIPESDFTGRDSSDYLTFLNNIHTYAVEDRIATVVGRSYDIWQGWRQPLKFLFVDGCHEEKYVYEDSLWTSRLVPGGVVVFHDYDNWPSVKQAVDKWFSLHKGGDVLNPPSSQFALLEHGPNIISYQRKGS